VTLERCADLSLAVGESLWATATRTLCWLLVEVPGGWSRDVGSSDALPPAARGTVSRWLERTEASRLLFIRRPGRVAATSLAFVVSATPDASVRQLELDSLDELSGVDLDVAGERRAGSLVLVCGHGSRDQCCALKGTAVFGVLEPELDDEQLWISSHQGGHRFAANVLVLPSGLQLGRVKPEEAGRVVSDALGGALDLDRFRGDSRYAPGVQAADIAVRRASGLTRVDDLRLVEVDGECVRFVGRDGKEHVALVEEGRGPAVPASCGADSEPQVSWTARLA